LISNRGCRHLTHANSGHVIAREDEDSTAENYANTIEIVMAMAGHKRTRDQDDYLSEMIFHYDREHDEPRKRGTPHERLRHLPKEAGMSASDLGRLLGNRGM